MFCEKNDETAAGGGGKLSFLLEICRRARLAPRPARIIPVANVRSRSPLAVRFPSLAPWAVAVADTSARATTACLSATSRNRATTCGTRRSPRNRRRTGRTNRTRRRTRRSTSTTRRRRSCRMRSGTRSSSACARPCPRRSASTAAASSRRTFAIRSRTSFSARWMPRRAKCLRRQLRPPSACGGTPTAWRGSSTTPGSSCAACRTSSRSTSLSSERTSTAPSRARRWCP